MQDLSKFEIPNIVRLEESSAKLVKIIISNDHADAQIYLFGGNLVHFQPKGEEMVIFEGTRSEMIPDMTLHAGIPICWPWFGPHPTDSSKPQHGFARNKEWQVREVTQLLSGETKVILGLNEDRDTLELFPHAFDLELAFVIGKELSIDLRTTNSGDEAICFSQALHSYFWLSDIAETLICGVENTPFADITDPGMLKSETASLKIEGVINRVYLPTLARCEIIDSGLKRKIFIDKKGSNSTTIWNPSANNNLHDLPGELYRKFVCIESCNTRTDSIALPSGATHHIRQIISLEREQFRCDG